jgi:hypothetical protein
MPVLVMKFGGTSVANIDRIRRAAKRVGVEVAKGYDVIVIVSAMSGKTNELVNWVGEISPLYDAREYDAVVSSGENVTAGLMALTLQEMDVPARSWQGWQVPLKTNSSHSSARIEEIPPDNINDRFAQGMRVAVVAGFQGISPEGRITTLVGRTPPPWPLPQRSMPSAATSTRMSTASIPPIRGSAPRRANWTRSRLRKCWNWRRSGPRCCKPARSSWRCATM